MQRVLFLTGKLYLPMINGANEGIQLMALFEVLSGLNGDRWIYEDTRFGYTIFQLATAFYLFSTWVSIPMNFYNIFTAVRQHQAEGADTGMKLNSVGVMMWRLLPITCTACLFLVWCFLSPSDISNRRPFLFLGCVLVSLNACAGPNATLFS